MGILNVYRADTDKKFSEPDYLVVRRPEGENQRTNWVSSIKKKRGIPDSEGGLYVMATEVDESEFLPGKNGLKFRNYERSCQGRHGCCRPDH